MAKEKSIAQQGFIPNFCRPSILLLTILFGELLALILSLASVIERQALILDLATKSLFIQWIVLTSAGTLCLIRGWLAKQHHYTVSAIAYITILASAFLVTELSWLFTMPFSQQAYYSTAHAELLLRSLGITAIIATITLRYFYVQNQWKTYIETTKHARFEALQARIRPHFLFNCINTIASLISIKPKVAEQTIENLADLLRASLSESLSLSPLEQELCLCKKYISIEKKRLTDRLAVTWDIEDLPLQASVPPLSLQPLIENAIYYGIEPSQTGGEIKISGTIDKDMISIQVANCLSRQSVASTSHGYHISQKNILQRLQTIYGKQGDLKIKKTPQSYLVTLQFPYRSHEDIDR